MARRQKAGAWQGLGKSGPEAGLHVPESGLARTHELFELARRHVTPADLRAFAPNDPGYPSYVRAFEAVLQRGAPALEPTFDFTETIGLTRWSHASTARDPVRFRWFRVLTSTSGLLLEPDHFGEVPHYELAAILVDAAALRDAGEPEIPRPLLAAVCREVWEHPRYEWCMDRIFGLVGEILASEPEPAVLDARCEALADADRRHREWLGTEAGGWRHDRRPAFVWGLATFDQLHAVWWDRIAADFPETTPTAIATKERLLREGETWNRHDRVLD